MNVYPGLSILQGYSPTYALTMAQIYFSRPYQNTVIEWTKSLVLVHLSNKLGCYMLSTL